MYNVFKPNSLDDEEIKEFIKSSEHSILPNDTPSSIPVMFLTGYLAGPPYEELLLEYFKTPDLVYKQTKNGEPIFLRKVSLDDRYTEEGYLTLEYGLINFYEGSKSFIYDQEFWDAWHLCLKNEEYLGWATILADSEVTEAYKRIIDLGLLGDNVSMSPLKSIDKITKRKTEKIIPGFSKVKVTF